MNARPSVILRCDDRALSLATILQALELDAATGRLEVGGGHLELVDGQVVRAALGPWSGAEALYELFLRPPTGELVLHGSTPATAPPLGPTTSLVLEAARRQDDWSRLGGLVLAPAGAVDAEPRVRALLDALDGRRAVWEVADHVGRARTTVVAQIAPLVEVGALREIAPPRPPQEHRAPAAPDREPELGDDALFTLLDQGRALLRRGRLEDAAAAFERALAARPDHPIAAQNLRRARRLMEERP